MRMPGFTAETSIKESREYFLTRAPVQTDSRGVIPQFCYCECRLYRTCFRIPPDGFPFCFVQEFCIPHGNCPPGYCKGT